MLIRSLLNESLRRLNLPAYERYEADEALAFWFRTNASSMVHNDSVNGDSISFTVDGRSYRLEEELIDVDVAVLPGPWTLIPMTPQA